MRYGVISDIHSNLEALQAVLREIDAWGAQALVCLGDVVGYGPDPNECCDLLRARGCLVISGNHDEAAVSDAGVEFFNSVARQALTWTQTQLTPENRVFLAGLPRERKFENFSIVHGAPGAHFDYISDAIDAQRAFARVDSAVTFIGHTHTAEVFYQDGARRTYHQKLAQGGRVTIAPGLRYIINPGSVGQPRDLNPRSSCALFDEDREEVEIRRVTYDVGRVRERMRDVNLPSELGARLIVGY
ncbi:MAG: metallophosphoesterase family protein [Candidatus Eremiobacteraeota bacterium]|nr:metallophosphoesterase family protein [Candidatus Eremiobacteraeota bacterium]MBC5826525.1 metallophosphoesterase family protein [Candidatus Eremiobacteraeota bacterium]